jgi:DDE superfamily endonuclease
VPAPTSWITFLHLFAPCFTSPGQLLFEQLVTAWALCPGRRTLTRLWSVMPPERRQRYGAYARWVRKGKWSPDELWRRLVVHLVEHWVPEARLTLLLDDTLVNKSGRKVDGAGFFHDAVTSTAVAHKVTAWGLNVVVLALRVPSPWGGEPLALPVMICLHRKSKEGATEEEEELSLIELAAWMVFQLIEWLPNHRFRLVADGAYAPILRYDFPRTAVITRIRRDAALFDLAPPRTGRRGRPRTKGQRLATPLGMAATLTDADWTTVQVCFRGRMVERKLWSRTLLWYETSRSRPLLLVIVRDPSGHQHDDFFISSDTSISSAEVASLYSDRWAIEVTNRDLKQYLGIQHPQSWVGDGPVRVVALAGWLYSAVWHWYLVAHAQDPAWPDRPWYTSKRTPSFADALAALRSETWSAILGGPARDLDSPQIATTLISVLASAA